MNLTYDYWSEQEFSILLDLFSTLKEEKYYHFSQRLIPDTPNMYGIRQPYLKKMA